MDLQRFFDDLRELSRNVASIRRDEGGPADPRLRLEEAAQALDTTMEELRVAEEELRQQDDELELSRHDLEEERQRYRELFEFAPDAYLVTDLRGIIREANVAAAALLGGPPGYLLGRPLALHVAEAHRRAFRHELNHLPGLGRKSDWELRLRPYQGGAFPASVSITVVRTWEGTPVGLRWLIRDIAERKEREHRLLDALLARERAAGAQAETAERRFRELVEGLDAIIWEADAGTGRLTFVNRYAEELLGYPLEGWLGEAGPWTEAVHPGDRPRVLDARRNCLRDRRGQELEYRMIAADGRVLWFRESIRLAVDERGRPLGLRGVLWHISRRKKFERYLYTARREQAEQFSDLSYLHEISSRLSPALELEPLLEEILTAGMAAQGAEIGLLRLLDRERGELEAVASAGFGAEFLGRYARIGIGAAPCGRAIAADGPVIIEDTEADPDDALTELARLGGFRASLTTPLRTRAGELIGTITTCFRAPHRPPPRQARLVEVYAREAADFVENARLHRALREADRHKDRFLATLAHELRNPIGVILNAAALLRRGEPEPDVIDLLERQARRMSRLVEDLVDLSRIGRGAIELRKQPLELTLALTDAVASVRPQAEARGLALTTELPDEPLRLEADRARLEQVFINLLANAVRYTEPGGAIVLAAGRQGHEAVVRVRDTGIGIAPGLLPRVFDPFVQGRAPGGGPQAGLGIGLALVRRLVELHGGAVAAASGGPGRGSEFTVRLPLLSEA